MPRFRMSLFDWNGTVLDDFWLLQKVIEKIFVHFGVAPVPTAEEYLNSADGHWIEFYHDRGIPRAATKQELYDIGWLTIGAIQHRCVLHPGVRRMLRFCRKERLCRTLVTGENPKFLIARLLQHQLHGEFEKIYDGVRDKVKAIREMVEEHGLDPQEAFYVDDTIEGVAAARAVGVISIGITHGFTSPQKLLQGNPDFIAHSFADVERIIRENLSRIDGAPS